MSARQWIGPAIVAAAIAASFVVPRLEIGGGGGGPEPSGPTRGCDDARGEPRPAPTLCLLNAERRRRGLDPLRRNPVLDRAARRHAADMVERDYFAHESPDGTTPHQRIVGAGYRVARLTGENLAMGEREAGAPSSIVDGWMHSPGHRANILRPRFEEIGVAIVEHDEMAMYVDDLRCARLMRALVQRVTSASVTVEGDVVARIGSGLLVLLGVTHDDDEAIADRLADKVRALRVFRDDDGRMNEPLGDREVLCVSQFTLYGDTRKGNRPSYVGAARPEHAEPLYERFSDRLGAKRGVFGAMMDVALVNDGPVTLLLEV